MTDRISNGRSPGALRRAQRPCPLGSTRCFPSAPRDERGARAASPQRRGGGALLYTPGRAEQGTGARQNQQLLVEPVTRISRYVYM